MNKKDLEITLLHGIAKWAEGWDLDRAGLALRKRTNTGRMSFALDISEYQSRFDVRPVVMLDHRVVNSVNHPTVGVEEDAWEFHNTLALSVWNVPGTSLKDRIVMRLSEDRLAPSVDEVCKLLASELLGPVHGFLARCATAKGLDQLLNRDTWFLGMRGLLHDNDCRIATIAAWLLNASDYPVLREKYRAYIQKYGSSANCRENFDALLKELDTLARPKLVDE